MALEIAIINGHPVVVNTPITGVPYYTNDNITFANADKVCRMNFAGSSKSTNPSASDWNYLPGAVWANTGTDQLYFCVDNTSGAAQWKALGTISSVGSGLTGDGNTTPLRVAISPNANNSLSLLANGLYGQANSNAVEFYPEDYGAIPGYILADATGLAAAQANADAISACIAAAWDYGNTNALFDINYNLGGASGTKVVNIAGDVGTRILPVVVIDKHFQIAKPISIPQQGGYITIRGFGGAISRWGYEDGIYSWDYQNPSGTWAVEIGQPYTAVSTVFHTNIDGLRFYGFPRALRFGIAPNNVNVGRLNLRYCYFAGPRSSPKLQDTIGVRLFNRSADIVFEGCTWNTYGTALDIQSIDRVKLYNCRIQIGPKLFENTHLKRRPDQGQIVLQHGRLTIDGFVGNPPLVDAAVNARLWQPNSGIVENQYIAFSGVSTLYGSGWSETGPTRTVWRSRVALTTSGTLAAETGNQANFTSKWEPVHSEIAGFGNIDTQRYFWVHAKEFHGWEPNKEYIPGDCILQNYSGTADPVYWSRINYTTGSGPTWAGDRHNWHVIDSMQDYSASEQLVAGDIRSSSSVFYRAKVNGALATPTGNNASWEIMTGILITDYENYSWLSGTRSQAGQPISAWSDVTIQGNTLLGAENGGLTPVYWAVPSRTFRANYAIGLESNGSNLRTYKWDITRKLPTTLNIKDSTPSSDRRILDIKFPNVPLYQTGTTSRYWDAPVVILSGIPNNMCIQNNYFNDVPAVAALYDPRLSVLPKPRYVKQGHYLSFTNINVSNNHGGSAGRTYTTNQDPSNAWYHKSVNYVPDDLQIPLFTQYISGSTAEAALNLIPAFSGNQYVSVGYMMTGIDPITSYKQLYRSKYNRLISSSFDLTERKYWDICETGSETDSPDVIYDANGFVNGYLCPGKYEYRMNNPMFITVVTFSDLEPGKVYTMFHENSNIRYQNFTNAGFLMATGSNNVIPSSGQVISFMPMNYRIIEINRNF